MTKMSVMNPFYLKLIQSIILACLVLQSDFVCSEEIVRCIESERKVLLQFKASLVDEFGMLRLGQRKIVANGMELVVATSLVMY